MSVALCEVTGRGTEMVVGSMDDREARILETILADPISTPGAMTPGGRIAPAHGQGTFDPDDFHPLTVRHDGGTMRGLPEETTAGRHLISLTAGGSASVSLTVLRAPEGTDIQSIAATLRRAILLGVVPDAGWTFSGGVWAEAGGRGEAVVDLTGGSWLVGAVAMPADGTAEPSVTVHRLAVSRRTTRRRPTRWPTAGQHLTLHETAITGIERRVRAGGQVWELTNVGAAPREVVLFSADRPIDGDGFVTDLEATLMGEPVSAGNSLTRVTWRACTGLLSPGQTAWAGLDLTPGHYLATSWALDAETGRPAVSLGMHAGFSVIG